MKIRSFVVLGAAGGLLLLVGFFASRSNEAWSPAENYGEIFQEITSLEVSIRNLTPDHSGSKLAYTRSADTGLALVIVDLDTLEQKEVFTDNDVTQVHGWSPDDRYLAFLQMPPARPGYQPGGLRDSWLTLYDSETGGVRRITDASDVGESYFLWLTSETYLYATKPVANPDGASEVYMGSFDDPSLGMVTNYMPQLIRHGDAGLAYTLRGNIYEMDIKVLPWSERWGWDVTARNVRQLTDWSADDFDQIRWLRSSEETGKFLFCARPVDPTWRYLFEFHPGNGELVQLTEEDTYNGQYVQGGRGFAYVGNPNNSFYLAVRPEDPEENVDLFTQGSVVTYAASPDGNRLYAHAAQGDEPHGIWEYNLSTQELRQVSSGMTRDFVASRVIEPEELRIASFDGKEIPAFFFTPPMLEESKDEGTGGLPKRRVKYPAVIYIPPNSAQMQRSFGPRSQFLANIGFYFLAVNYRGVDGYGRDYSDSYHPPTAAKDILAAYEWLIQNPNVDRKNIFIFSMSGGTPICMELLATAPKLWRGMAIDKPGGMPVDARLNPRRLPKLFLITGDQDPAMASVQRFAEWAKENRVDLQMEIYENAAHITFDLESRRRSQREVAEFYIRSVK